MEPLPEVSAAAARLAALAEESVDLLPALRGVSALAVTLLPSCVGVSITVVLHGEPFTVTATTPAIASVDASQYLLDEGPCLEAAADAAPVSVDDVLDEQRWHDYAQVAAARGIRASLSIPLTSIEGQRIGALNLYASDPFAFRGHEERVAKLFGAHVEEVVSNADLSFMTREFARALPQRLDDHDMVNQAVGLLIRRHGLTAPQARARMTSAADRAGITMAAAAEMVLLLGGG